MSETGTQESETNMDYDEKPVDDGEGNQLRITVDEGEWLVDLRCTGEMQEDGSVKVTLTQAELIELMTYLPGALHVATKNGSES